MENKMNEAREFMKKAGEKMQPVVEDLREKAEPVAEKVREGAEAVVDRVKEAAEDVGSRLQKTAPGADFKNEFFSALEDEAREMKNEAGQKADEMQKKLEALMRGEAIR